MRIGGRMATIAWSRNVSYNPTTHSVIFHTVSKQGNTVIAQIDYYRELYPRKSWMELAVLAIPELARVRNKKLLKFYSL